MSSLSATLCGSFSSGRAEAFPEQMGLKPTSYRPQPLCQPEIFTQRGKELSSGPAPALESGFYYFPHPLSASLMPTSRHDFTLW